jgi:tetratricopeptide (TPR) repeat protein
MKKYILTFATLLIACTTYAQNPAKGFKAMEAGDYAEAKTIFEGALVLDANDAAANFGLSRYYGTAKSGEQDREKALEYLIAAEKNYPDDEKAQSKLAKTGMSTAELISRRDMLEKGFLEDAKDVNTVEALNAFLDRFPESSSLAAAANYRNKIAYSDAQKSGTVAAMDQFIATYPDAYENKTAIPERDKAAAEVALKTNTEEGYLHFIQSYPEAIQAPQIKARLVAVAFENAKAINTIDGYQEYLANYPESIFVAQAKQKLEWLESKAGN